MLDAGTPRSVAHAIRAHAGDEDVQVEAARLVSDLARAMGELPRYRARHGRRRRVVTHRSRRGSPPRRALERRRRSDRGRVLRRRIRHSRRGVRADTRRDLTGPPRGQGERETRRGRGGRRNEIRRPVTDRPDTALTVTANSPPPARRRGRGRPRHPWAPSRSSATSEATRGWVPSGDGDAERLRWMSSITAWSPPRGRLRSVRPRRPRRRGGLPRATGGRGRIEYSRVGPAAVADAASARRGGGRRRIGRDWSVTGRRRASIR